MKNLSNSIFLKDNTLFQSSGLIVKKILFYKKWIAISLIIILLSGCLEQESTPEASPSSEQEIHNQVQKKTVNSTPILRISDDLSTLKSKGWSTLSGQLGRTKITTLLWYHIKSNYDIETKIVFGNPNKLNSCIAILASKGGESTLPKINIKDEEYYVINPDTPGIINEFSYGYVFDDPRGADNFLQGSFALRKSDHDIIEQWMGKSGVTVSYSDFKK